MTRVQHGDHHYFVLSTTDIDVSRGFFTELLNWRFEQGELTNLAFFGSLTDSHERSIWIHVDDRDATCERVLALGGTVDATTDDRSGANAICRDDQGNRFHFGTLIEEFRDYPHPPSAPIGELGYFTYAVGDTAIGAAFYGALFGWEFTAPGEAGVQADYRHCTNGALPFGLTAGGDVSPAFYFTASGLDRAATQIEALGGEAGRRINSETGDTLAGCADPAGVRFAVWAPAPGV
ncbi:MAG: VOC family protein [Actinomycetota bacterium]